VLVVRKRQDLLRKVLPWLTKHPLISGKRREFEAFSEILEAMDRNEHLTEAGFVAMAEKALRMNGGGRYRKKDWKARILRGHTPDTT
jgi:hypothetical protein